MTWKLNNKKTIVDLNKKVPFSDWTSKQLNVIIRNWLILALVENR